MGSRISPVTAADATMANSFLAERGGRVRKLSSLSVQSVAILAEPIGIRPRGSSALSFVHRYVATGRASAVVVVNTVSEWFVGFVGGIKHLRHVISPLGWSVCQTDQKTISQGEQAWESSAIINE